MQSEPLSARTQVWPLSISLAATLEIDVSFSSSGYLDVSVHRVPGVYLWIQYTSHEVSSCRFPHSDIHGSLVICTSPWLFAAYHVFRRLLVPRHPPCALFCLTFIHSVVCRLVAFFAFLSFQTRSHGFGLGCLVSTSSLIFDLFVQYSVFKVQCTDRLIAASKTCFR